MTEDAQNSNFGSMIAASARLGLGYLDRLAGDVSAEHFSRLAVAGDQTVDANHPAFILGHLSIYPSRVVKELGFDASGVEPSAEYLDLFAPGNPCVDDPDGNRYPGKDELLTKVRTGYEAAIDALQRADDAAFRQPNPNEKMASKFATVGAMHGFYVGGHFMMHMGQLSTWRRVMGYPAG